MIPPLFGKQEVGIWWVQKRFPRPTIWGTYMKLVTKYQISPINSCWEKCDEKCAYMFNVYIKYQLSRQTGCRNLTGPKTLPTIWYTYDACDQISDFCHQELLRKMQRKISWTDGRTDRGKTVYPPPPLGSGGIKIKWFYLHLPTLVFLCALFGKFYVQSALF
jgi:hypothetical protein